MRDWVSFGAGSAPALLIRSELDPSDRRAVQSILATLGARGASGPVARREAPSLLIRRLQDHDLARSLAGLMPGDAVWCVRDGQVGQHCHDGAVRYSENDSATEVQLAPNVPPSLSGALGVGLVRSLSIAGNLVLHAAALHYRGLTLLALGPSGAGKSTLCAAALRAGGRVVSDDLVLLTQPDEPADVGGQIWLHPYRADMLLREGSHRLLPNALADTLKPEQRLSGPKLRLDRGVAPEAFAARAALSCIAILGQGPRRASSQVRPLDQAGALVGILSALLYRLSPIARGPLMDAARRLASGYPAVQLDVGARLLSAPVDELEQIHTALLTARKTAGASADDGGLRLAANSSATVA